jgi:hypothetical protein
MSVNPIDIIRTQEASQIKHIENQRTQHMQDQVSKNFEAMIEQEQQKPKEPTKSENTEYRYDAKKKGNNQYYGDGHNKKEAKKEKPKMNAKPNDGGIDILI